MCRRNNNKPTRPIRSSPSTTRRKRMLSPQIPRGLGRNMMVLVLLLLFLNLWSIPSLSVVTRPVPPPDPPFVLPRDSRPESSASQNVSSTVSSPFAYVFLLGGLDPQNLTPFRGYLYNIMVAAHTLRSTQSQADIVVLIQPASSTSQSDSNSAAKLPLKWQTLLQDDMGIQVQYLPLEEKESPQSFFSIMMQKFKVLELTQYQRVLFLDADIVPFCNLDYLFHASMSGILQPNFVLAGTDAPAAGNLFLVPPQAGEYDTMLHRIVQPTLSAGKWNGKQGWGHVIDRKDPWQRLGWGGSKFMRRYLHWGQKGYHWNFHGGPADQGLLYHWVKYVKRNVTIAVGPLVETWKDGGSGNFVDQPLLINQTRTGHPLHALSCRKSLPRDYMFRSKEGGTAPYSDYEHNKKIWERRKLPPDVSSRYAATTPAQFWFHTLRFLDHTYDLRIDWDHWLEHIGNKERPFGKGPKLSDFEAAGEG